MEAPATRPVDGPGTHRAQPGRKLPLMALLEDKVVLVNGGTQGVGAAHRPRRRARGRDRRRHRPPRRGRREARGELTSGGGRRLRAGRPGRRRAGRGGRATGWSRRHGRVDCLVNAAGLTSRGTLLDTTPELFDAHIAVNLRGPFFAMQAVVARHGRAARRPARSSTSSRSRELGGQPYLAPYVAAKAGLAGAHPQRRPRPPLGPHPDQRPQHRLDRHRGRGRHPARVPRCRRRLARAGRRVACRWASSASPTRSPTSSSSCCPTAAAWSPAR